MKNATSRSSSSGRWCNMTSSNLRRPSGVSACIAKAFIRDLSSMRSDGHCPATFSNTQAARHRKESSLSCKKESRASSIILSAIASAAIVVINVLQGRAERRKRKLSCNDSDGLIAVLSLWFFFTAKIVNVGECANCSRLTIFMILLLINKSAISSINQEKALTLICCTIFS